MPDAGRSPLSLPIHALSQPTPEEQFAAAADDEPLEVTDEDRLAAYREGRSIETVARERRAAAKDKDEPAPTT